MCKLALILLSAALAAQSAFAADTRLQRWPADVPVPSLQLKDLEGNEWNLQSLRGKVVVLNFWATWCAPCVDELPILNELAASEFSRRKVIVLGVNFKESTATIQRFSSEHPFHYPVLMDKSGDYFRNWSNGVLPATVLIDQRGRPRWRLVGELTRADADLKQAIEKLLEEPGSKHAERGTVKTK